VRQLRILKIYPVFTPKNAKKIKNKKFSQKKTIQKDVKKYKR